MEEEHTALSSLLVIEGIEAKDERWESPSSLTVGKTAAAGAEQNRDTTNDTKVRRGRRLLFRCLLFFHLLVSQ